MRKEFLTRGGYIVLLLLALLPGVGASAWPLPNEDAPADEWFIAGVNAFLAGQEEAAVNLFVESVKRSPYCRAFFEDPGYDKPIMRNTCSQLVQKPSDNIVDDPTDNILFRLGSAAWNAQTARCKETSCPQRGQHSGAFYDRLLKEYPNSPYADKAGLRILEDGFCETWAGYPDCARWEIRQYENFLNVYPRSEFRAGVLLSMADRYAALSEFYDQERAWENPAMSELCRSQAVQLYDETLKKSKDQKIIEAASAGRGKLLRTGRPIVHVPVFND